MTTVNSSSVSGPGFFRIASGTASLPMSWSRPPIARPAGREAELVTDLRRPQRDAARVLLRVGVLVGELDEERADVGAEERLRLGNEIRAAEVTEERP